MNPSGLLKHVAIIVSILLLTTFQISFADDQIPLGQTEDAPLGQGELTAEETYGEEGGKFHPFLLFEAQYTDNLFYTSTNEESDLICTVAPGLWVAVPANKEKLLEISTSTTSPGGLQVSRMKPEANRRWQSYLMYSPQFVFYSDFSEHDHTNHRIEGLLQYNFASGFSIDLMDQYNIREEINDNGIDNTLYEYTDNIFSVIATYEPSEKFLFRTDFSNYQLDYDETFNEYRDRTDNTFAFYVFYKIRPKTSIFAEYEFADINFDAIGGLDSQEDRYYGGLAWEMTAKTRGQVKIGLIKKDFDDPALEDDDQVSAELQLQHNFSGNKGLTVTGYRMFNESTLTAASHFSVTGITAAYLHRFNSKWSGSISGTYRTESYEGLSRDDDVISFSPAIRFKPKNWLIFDLGYQYSDRDSSISVYDYTVNIFYFRVNLSL